MNMIVRVVKTENYTVMSNHHLRNKDLSLKAKGLMSYMLSCSNGTTFSIRQLMEASKDGEASVCTALNELKEHKYLKHYAKKDDKGRISEWIYDLYELPFEDKDTDVVFEEKEDKSPELDFPDAENPDKVNTDYNVNTIKKENIKKETDEVSCDPNLERAKDIAKKEMESMKSDEDSFIEVWNLYNKKEGKQQARKAWMKLSNKDKEAVKQKLSDWLSNYISRHGKQYQPMFSTFLNQRRWEDEINENNEQSATCNKSSGFPQGNSNPSSGKTVFGNPYEILATKS